MALSICVVACTMAMEGAVLFTPALLFLFPAIIEGFPRLSPYEVIGVGLIVELVGYSSSAYGYHRQGVIDYGLAKSLLRLSVPFAIAARLASSLLPAKVLILVFGLVLLLLALILASSSRWERKASGGRCITAKDGRKYYCDATVDRTGELSASIAGTFGGLIGVGIGEVLSTLLLVRYAVPMRVAIATSVLVVSVTVLTASLTHLYSLMAAGIAVPWNIVIVFAPAVLLGGQIAPYVSANVREKTLRKSLILMYVLVGGIMLYRGLM